MVRKPALLLRAYLILFRVGSGRLGSARSDDGNSDNRANSVQLPIDLQAGTELGNKANSAQLELEFGLSLAQI